MSDVIEIFADGTQVEREFTVEEIAQREADRLENLARKEAEALALGKKEAALAKLEALGLDIEDLKAIGLG